jgi:hypothetical protein
MAKKVYVIKYALTQGIRECALAEPWGDGLFCQVKWPGGLNGQLFLRKSEVRESLPTAVIASVEMAKARIESLKKQIAKLEQIDEKKLTRKLK